MKICENICPKCNKPCVGLTCYKHSEKRRQTIKKYQKTEKGKEIQRNATKKYKAKITVDDFIDYLSQFNNNIRSDTDDEKIDAEDKHKEIDDETDDWITGVNAEDKHKEIDDLEECAKFMSNIDIEDKHEEIEYDVNIISEKMDNIIKIKKT